MKAVNYHVALPYPSVSGLQPNEKQAMLLMEGYCGTHSELTTVTQYAYHHLRCLENRELSRAFKGIFQVETHHLELLGRCICQLGADPRYYLVRNQRKVSWTAKFVNYGSSMSEMLRADIEGEEGAAEYYIKAAQEIGNDKIAPLLLRLAEDEKLHVRILSSIYRRYFSRDEGSASTARKDNPFSSLGEEKGT